MAASDSFGLSASATVDESRLGPASSVEGVSQLIDAIGTAIGLEPALFDLAVCAEMVFLDLPFEQRVRRIAEFGFQVEIWNWTYHDIDALVQTGARFSSMVGHTAGSLLDDDGADALLQSAEESLAVAERPQPPPDSIYAHSQRFLPIVMWISRCTSGTSSSA